MCHDGFKTKHFMMLNTGFILSVYLVTYYQVFQITIDYYQKTGTSNQAYKCY